MIAPSNIAADWEFPESLYPFWPEVPTDVSANIEYRANLRERAARDNGLQRDLIVMCRYDTLFFFGAFLWCVEPRESRGDLRIRPFIPRPHQLPAIVTMDHGWGKQDCLWEKSRGEGATYLLCGRMLKDWLWEKHFKAGIASMTLAAVDTLGELSSVMPKIDFMLEHLPVWMQPPAHKLRRTTQPPLIHNLLNGSTIRGYSATDDLGTGGRMTVWLWDEMAKFPVGKDQAALDSTAPTSECRHMVSTYKGTNNAYYRLIRNPGRTPVIRMHWVDNPERNRGLFTCSDVNGMPVAVDADRYGEVPADFLAEWPQVLEELSARGYAFNYDQYLSAWYVYECLRPGNTPRTMAQEYDMDPQGTESSFFARAKVEFLRQRSAIEPSGRYSLVQDDATGDYELYANPVGPLRLWMDVDRHNQPCMEGPVVIGCDVSQGVASDTSTNSVAAIFELHSGMQIGEYVVRDEDPREFAETAVGLATLFSWQDKTAYLGWEHEGTVGTRFFKRVRELNFHHYYRRWKIDAKKKTRTEQPGVSTSGQKDVILGDFRAAYYAGKCTIVSAEGHDELLQFIYDDNGKLINTHEKNSDDPSGTGRSHADRGMAYAVAWALCLDKPSLRRSDDGEEGSGPAPPGSIAARRQQSRERESSRFNRFNPPPRSSRGGNRSASPGSRHLPEP